MSISPNQHWTGNLANQFLILDRPAPFRQLFLQRPTPPPKKKRTRDRPAAGLGIELATSTLFSGTFLGPRVSGVA